MPVPAPSGFGILMRIRFHSAIPTLIAVTLVPNVVLLKGRDSNALLKNLQRKVASEPANADAHAALGVLLGRRADFENAAIQLGTAVQLKPESASYAMELGKVLLLWRHYGTAYDYLNAIRDRFGTSPQFRYEFAYAIYGRKQYEQALAQVTGLIHDKPNMADAYYLQGNCYWALNDLPSAIISYRKAINRNDRNAAYYTALAKLLRASGKLDDAVSSLKKAIAIDGSNLDANFELALCLEKKGDLTGAEELLEEGESD